MVRIVGLWCISTFCWCIGSCTINGKGEIFFSISTPHQVVAIKSPKSFGTQSFLYRIFGSCHIANTYQRHFLKTSCTIWNKLHSKLIKKLKMTGNQATRVPGAICSIILLQTVLALWLKSGSPGCIVLSSRMLYTPRACASDRYTPEVANATKSLKVMRWAPCWHIKKTQQILISSIK